jgi:adenylate cyclase
MHIHTIFSTLLSRIRAWLMPVFAGRSFRALNRPGLLLHAGEVGYALLLLAWFFVPLFAHGRGGLVPPLLPLSFLDSARGDIAWFLVVTCVVYPIPILCMLKICAPLLERRAPALADPTRIVPIILTILVSGLALATLGIQLVTFAEGPGFFRSLPWLAYAAFLASIGWNAFSLGHLIVALNRRNPAYQEYLQYRTKERGRVKGPFAALRRKGIQRRMGLAILPFVLAIIVVPSLVVMRDFCRTALASAISDGEALAERTANVVRANAAAIDPLADYLVMEARRNRDSAFPFMAISYVERDARTGLFEVAASTDRSRIGRKVSLKDSTMRSKAYRLTGKRDDFEFISPVSLSGSLAGYVSVEVDRDVIYEPYFRAMVKVLLIAAISAYAAIFLAYLFGRSIVFPILSLSMSVSEFSRSVSDMIRGRSRVGERLLRYHDRVHTQDELKMLSNEVGAMARVIRGVIPYISGSTLSHSEREKPKTERKNLAFLFTDIRGFTAFCEGQSPDTVVDMLNRYLELQAGIILANGGDIDKFVGDEIMAVFKGPGKELAACRAGDQIRASMAMERKLADLAGRQVISIGIGIHSGPVVFGSIGARDRMDFTSIGDTVNLAARLEGANKSYGTRALVSEVVHEKVKSSFLCREIDLLTVKGKQQPVRIFELLEQREKASDGIHEIRRVFEEGLALYRQQVWAGAEKCFSFLRERFQDEASEVFLRRIEVFKAAPPPPRWDGVFSLAVK